MNPKHDMMSQDATLKSTACSRVSYMFFSSKKLHCPLQFSTGVGGIFSKQVSICVRNRGIPGTVLTPLHIFTHLYKLFM